jgi:hypothetical protein
MDYTRYAIDFGLVENEEQLFAFRYSCYTGVKAVEKLFEHRNQQYHPRILPHHRTTRTTSPDTLVGEIGKHLHDGENVEVLIKSNTKQLGEQVELSQEVALLSDRKRCLDQGLEYTLPAYTECEVKISSAELIRISFELPHVRPLKRKNIEDILELPGFVEKQYSVDEVISGLVKFSLI